MESTAYVLSFRMVFFYLVTTGWIFYTSLCVNSINIINSAFMCDYSGMYVSVMYVSMTITYSRGKDHPGKGANPARGQLAE